MTESLNRRIVGVGLVAFLGCLIMSVYAASEAGELTFEEVVRRLVALEKRVDRLESQVVMLRQSGTAPLDTGADKPMIEITSPANGAEVGMEVVLEGIVRVEDLGDRWPVVGVHPMLTDLIWTQPIPLKVDKTADGYRFRCRVYCGTRGKGIGEKFEIYAFLAKKGAMNEADVLEKLPEDIPVSESVLVTRVTD